MNTNDMSEGVFYLIIVGMLVVLAIISGIFMYFYERNERIRNAIKTTSGIFTVFNSWVAPRLAYLLWSICYLIIGGGFLYGCILGVPLYLFVNLFKAIVSLNMSSILITVLQSAGIGVLDFYLVIAIEAFMDHFNKAGDELRKELHRDDGEY